MSENNVLDVSEIIAYLKKETQDIVSGAYKMKDSPREEKFIGLLDVSMTPTTLIIFDHYGSVTMIPLTSIEYIKIDHKWDGGKKYVAAEYYMKFVNDLKKTQVNRMGMMV